MLGTSLALSLLLGNNIGDEGLADVAAALLTCSSLVELDLSREYSLFADLVNKMNIALNLGYNLADLIGKLLGLILQKGFIKLDENCKLL